MPPEDQKPVLPNNNTPAPTPNSSPRPTPTGPPKVFGPGEFSAQPYVGAPDPLPASKRRLPKILIIAVLVIILIGSGGAYAYWMSRMNSPEMVLADALSNTMTDLLERRPATSVGSLVYESKGSKPYKVTIDFDAKQQSDDYETTATLQFEGQGVDITVEGALIIIETKELYVRFDNLEKTAQDLVSANPDMQPWVDTLRPLLQKMDGRWINLNSQSATEAGLTESEHQVDACSDAVRKLRLSPEDQKNVKRIFDRHQFAIATEKLPEETAGDEESYHYKLDLNEEKSIRFTKELVELRSFATVKEDCEIEPEDFDQQLKALARENDNAPKPVIELWVGTESRLPTRLHITMDDKELTTTFDTTVKINAPDVDISAPSDAMPLTELLQDFEDLEVLGANIDQATQ